jgi:CRISPR system Cascade subunit CasE
MLISRLRLNPEAAWHLPPRGIYAAHQTVAEALDGRALWRADREQILAVSERQPRATRFWTVEGIKPYTPKLSAGEALRFALRANATITRDGKRHDPLINARHTGDTRPTREIAAELYPQWLRRQGERSGFEVLDVLVGSRARHQGLKDGKVITFWTADLSGVLKVCDGATFLNALTNGVGHARAFGAGLLLVARFN